MKPKMQIPLDKAARIMRERADESHKLSDEYMADLLEQFLGIKRENERLKELVDDVRNVVGQPWRDFIRSRMESLGIKDWRW